MEAGEHGLLDRVVGEPSGVPRLHFGSPEGIAEALEATAHRRGFGDAMADGTRRLAQTYGGAEFAMHVKGLDLPGYDPRGAWGQGLAYAVTNRGGCHLSASIFAQEAMFGYLNPYTTRAKAEFVHYLTNLSAAVNSLQTCVFTTFAYLLEPRLIKLSPTWLLRFAMQYLPNVAIAMLDIQAFTRLYQTVTGIPMSQQAFVQAGRRINTLERLMATREGITRADDTLPDRLLHEGRTCDPDQRTVPLDPMLDRYYRIAGWSPNGIPTEKTLNQLGLPPSA
jgi:aldehyde:ferredoxin oxidoreductase